MKLVYQIIIAIATLALTLIGVGFITNRKPKEVIDEFLG